MKTFLKLSFLFLGALFCFSCAEQPAVEVDASVQLYSIRDVIGSPELYAANSREAFQTLAEMGYTSVEAAYFEDGKFYGVSPEEFKADVEAAGLKVLSSHTNRPLTAEEYASGDYSAALEWWDDAIPAHKAAGMEYIVIPWLGLPKTLADLKTYCDYLNAVGKKCAEYGIGFGYHSHSHEYTKIEDCVAFDFMMQNTDPEYVFFQMDVYWAVVGDASPVEYFKKYPGRFKMLHIKDLYVLGESGMVGFDAIFSNFDVSGTENIVVEQEEFTSNGWKADMQANVDYLRWLKTVIK